MELYTLDSRYRRMELIEGYESFVWTERYTDIGEMELKTASDRTTRSQLVNGTLVGLSESNRVMKIETVSDTEDDQGNGVLSISGTELSSVLHDRIAKVGTGGSKPNTWVYTGKPSDIIRALFDFACRVGTQDKQDVIPLLIPGGYLPGNLAEDTTRYTIERDITTLYAAIKELADIWDLGFRLYKLRDEGNLYFDVYKGYDRTTTQSEYPAVIFSPELDSLQNVAELKSIKGIKNVAEVRNVRTAIQVTAEGISNTISGFERRVLFVNDTTQYGTSDKALTAAESKAMLTSMTTMGKQELAKHRSTYAFDGEVTQSSPYKYNRDYSLGDLVEMRNADGNANQMLVTEQIFAADATGENAYPTLTLKQFIESGTWLSWENTSEWVNAPGIWSTM